MLELIPISLAEANAFVESNHSHHGPVAGHKFSIGCALGEKVVGVIIVGRPVSRHLDDGWTLEATRCCTDGTKNAASKLYGAACRAAFALGYKKVITYTLESEKGASLTATRFKAIGTAGGGSWNVPSRPRVDKHPTQLKIRWECEDA